MQKTPDEQRPRWSRWRRWLQSLMPLWRRAAWPLVAVVALVAYRTPLTALLDRVQSFKGYGVELSLEKMTPMSPEQQGAKLMADVQIGRPIPVIPLLPARPASAVTPLCGNASLLAAVAEDLAVRAVQQEFGKPIARQLTGGRDGGFDGIFTMEQSVYVVEVQYIEKDFHGDTLRRHVEALAESIRQYPWPNSKIVLAVVFRDGEEMDERTTRLHEMLADLPATVLLRTYSFRSLKHRFGLVARQAAPSPGAPVRSAHSTFPGNAAGQGQPQWPGQRVALEFNRQLKPQHVVHTFVEAQDPPTC